MGLTLATRKPPPPVDEFRMARRHSIWFPLSTAETGTWAWSPDSGAMFGGRQINVSNAAGDSKSFANLNLFSAGVKLNLLHTKASTGCLVKVYWGTKGNPSDLIGSFSTWSASTAENVVEQIDLGVVAKGRKTLHLVADTAGPGGGYEIQIQQAEVVQLTGDNTGESIDDLPWWTDAPIYSYINPGPGTFSLVQNTNFTFGSFVSTPSAESSIDLELGLFHGVYAASVIYQSNTNRALVEFELEGSSIGDIDMFGSPATNNVIGTIGGITVEDSGLKTVTLSNLDGPISGNALAQMQWLQFRKTAAHGAITPTGKTYAPSSRELYPWFAEVSDLNTFIIGNHSLYYGYYYNNPNNLNDEMLFEVEISEGPCEVELIGPTFSSYGVCHLSLDGADIDTTDRYSPSVAYNVKSTMTGELSGGTLRFGVDSINPSATNQILALCQIRLKGA